MGRFAFVLVLVGCGPAVDPSGGSAAGTTEVESTSASNSSSSATSSASVSEDSTSTDATSIEATAEATTLPATSLLPESSSSGSTGSTGEPPLDECTLPRGETATVTGTIAGEPVDLRYATFGWTGGGKCPAGWRIVIVESLDVFEQHLDELPGAHAIAPRIEMFVDADAEDEMLPPGEYAAEIEVQGNDADTIYAVGTVVVEAGGIEEPGAVFEGSITLTIEDPSVDLSGTFAAAICTDLDYGGCGA